MVIRLTRNFPNYKTYTIMKTYNYIKTKQTHGKGQQGAIVIERDSLKCFLDQSESGEQCHNWGKRD